MKDKLQSRKFWAWIIWTAIIVLAIFRVSGLNLSELLPWYGGITLVWMGVQGGADIIKKVVK
jgi:uncharacterized membrane protein YhaH (DUF805 family)